MDKRHFDSLLPSLVLAVLLAATLLLTGVSCEEHKHAFSRGWTYDANFHWHVATCGHDVVKDKAAHDWPAGTCTVCGLVDASGMLDVDASGNISVKSGSKDLLPVVLVIPGKIRGVAVTSIVNDAFSDCKKLANVTIPSSVTNIGVSAFYGCAGLTSVAIPSSVTSIGELAFSGCTVLTNVTVNRYVPSDATEITSLGQNCFDGCSSLATIKVPSVAIATYKSAGNWSEHVTKIVAQ